MRKDQPSNRGESRRQFFRSAAIVAAGVSLPLLARDKAQASGRHSDPDYCEPVCLLRGSRVETMRGEVAIESLKRGDLIKTESGRFESVKWVGRKVFRKAAGASWTKSVDPVRIARSAVAPGVPSRDLFVSPRHALYIDGYLMPAKYLVNGTTIAQGVHDGDVVEYFHVECEGHEVMLAQGLPVETLQLHGMAESFSNFAERARLYGDELVAMEPYAPVLGYWNRRDDLKAYLRGICSVCVDLRDPLQVAHDRLAERALALDLEATPAA